MDHGNAGGTDEWIGLIIIDRPKNDRPFLNKRWQKCSNTFLISCFITSNYCNFKCFSGSTAILFCLKNELRFLLFHNETKTKETKSTNVAWIDQQSNLSRTSKCMLQSLTELRGTPDTKTTRKHMVCNASHLARSFQASKHTYFLNLLLLLPAALKVLIYEVTFFCVSMSPW